MPVRPIILLALAVLSILIAAVAWTGSLTGHAEALHHLSSMAPDGRVESYTPEFHDRIRANLRTLTAGALLCALVALAAWWRYRPRGAATSNGLLRFRLDLNETLRRYAKRTSPGHKRAVATLTVVGTALRAWMMFAPVSYDEAFTWTYYASRPVHVILCEYSYPNNHVFHTLLVKLSTALFTTGLFSLRLPALVAGVLLMPAFYLFVRATFNRYIGLLALALVAASPVLVEYSALARGYSITWLCLVCALLLGRHFLKEGSRVSAVLMGLVLAIGTWTVPTMVYPAIMVLVWLALQVMMRHGGLANERMRRLVGSALIWIAVTALLYLPILVVYGSGHLLDHPILERPDRVTFFRTLGDQLLTVHAHLVGTNWMITRVVALVLCVIAGYYSGRYRSLVFAAVCGAVPLMLMQGHLAPARVWLYLVLFVHLGVAIGLFYLLKLIQEKVLPNWGKRQRIIQTSAVLVLLTAWPLTAPLPVDVVRCPEVREVAEYLHSAMEPGDRVYTKFPWDAPIEFHAVAEGMDRAMLHREPQATGIRFVAVGLEQGQTVAGILHHHQADTSAAHNAELVLDLPRLGIFAVR